MVAPTTHVRGLVLLRDGSQCVSCSTHTSPLEMNHRQSVGGGGSKVRPMPHELNTACSRCNMRFESDLLAGGLAHGWKVRKWVDDCSRVPMFHAARGRWGLLSGDGGVQVIARAEAYERMRDVYGEQWDQWAAEAGLLARERTA